MTGPKLWEHHRPSHLCSVSMGLQRVGQNWSNLAHTHAPREACQQVSKLPTLRQASTLVSKPCPVSGMASAILLPRLWSHGRCLLLLSLTSRFPSLLHTALKAEPDHVLFVCMSSFTWVSAPGRESKAFMSLVFSVFSCTQEGLQMNESMNGCTRQTHLLQFVAQA